MPTRSLSRFVVPALVALAVSAPAAGAADRVVVIPSPGPGPASSDRVAVLQQGPAAAERVLVLMPGTSAGAANFKPVAQALLARLPGWQIWSVERRENALEDHTALSRALTGKATGQQLFDVEGLDQVIVGARLQALDLVLPARTRREDQDRELLALGAQRLHQVHARHLGQAQVDHGDVERNFATVVQAFFAVTGRVHGETLSLEPRGQGFTQRGFILDQQYAHVVSLSTGGGDPVGPAHQWFGDRPGPLSSADSAGGLSLRSGAGGGSRRAWGSRSGRSRWREWSSTRTRPSGVSTLRR